MARPLRDPVAQSIEGLSQAITADRPQWQQTVTQAAEGLAARVVEHVEAPLTTAIRRSVSTSRTRPIIQPAVMRSGNVMPGATFSQFTGDIPDLNNPPRFDDGVPNLTSEENERRLNDFVNWDRPESTTADHAARIAEEARRIVEDIAASGNGGQIPPQPPNGGDPPDPPDEPDDDGILRQLLDFFQRMFGVRPDIANRNLLDTLANNLTSILGGVIPQPNAEGQRPTALTTLMDTFADYFGVPRETADATREAQENLRRSIDRLTEATNGAANGGTPSQPQGRFARIRSFFRRRGRTRRGGIAMATRMANFMRPLFRGIANTVPARWRQAAGQAGANVMGRLAPFLNIPATTAARFGAAMPVAALAVGVLARAIPVIGSVITATIGGLNKLADQALKTTFALASYGGLLAHANAQLEMNREMRKFDMANKMGVFGAERLGQLNRLENAMQPWQIMGNNAGNMFGAAVDAVLAGILETLNNILATGMEINAAILDFIPGNQNEDNMRKAAAKLRNPAADMPQPWQGREAMFGQNAVDMIDLGKRVAGPRKPVNGGN